MTGPSNGRFDFFPGFIINTTDGRWVSAHSGSVVQKRGVEFSEDMSCAVWTTPYSYKETKLMTVDLAGNDLSPIWTGVVFDRHWSELVVSPAGHRVAVIHGGTVSVFDIDSGELLAAAQPRSDYSPFRLHFTDELNFSRSPLFSPRCSNFEFPQPRLSISAIPREKSELLLGFDETIFN